MIKVLKGQSVIDIAIQELGSVEGVYTLATQNGISITDELVPGQEIQLPNIQNKSISAYYANKAIKPATASTDQITEVSRVFFEELPFEFT